MHRRIAPRARRGLTRRAYHSASYLNITVAFDIINALAQEVALAGKLRVACDTSIASIRKTGARPRNPPPFLVLIGHAASLTPY